MATNLGTAYVSVMPSMKGFGAAVESGMSDIDTAGAGSKMGQKAAGGFAGGMAKGGIIMGAASALTTKAFDAVASSADRAISRVDTMKNFPKVMSNLGVEAGAAEAAVNKISDGLTGLPTALDTGVAAVQRFTSFNGDVSKSADMFLAVNDAILAGGMSSGLQASAIEQLSQAYTKGKMDMMEWRTLQQAMPAQLKQVADAMGLTTEQLGDGLRQAEKADNYIRDIPMDEFIGKIMELDQAGGDGIRSFAQQAKDATTGIDTAMANMNTAVVRSVADVINAFGQENISSGINYLGTKIGEVGKVFAAEAKGISTFLDQNKDSIKAVVDALAAVAPAAINAYVGFKLFQGGKALFSGISSAISGGIATLGRMGTAAQGLGFAMKNAGIIGAQSMYTLGGIMSDVSLVFGSMTLGATGLVAGLAVGIAALYAYNQSLGQAAYAAAYLTAEEQALIDASHAMSESFGETTAQRNDQISSVNAEFETTRALKDEYNSLVDANGQIIAGNEERAASIIGELASAMGVEREDIYSLIDSYGHLGEAADAAMEKRRAEKILQADEQAYTEATTNIDACAQSVAKLGQAYETNSQEAAKANQDWADSNQFMLDTASAMPEAIGIAAMGMQQVANSATGASDAAVESAKAYGEATETYAKYADEIANHEGLAAAIASEDAAQIEEWSTRVTESIQTAENGSRASLEAQVQSFQTSYDQIAAAVANGDTSLQGSLDNIGSALQIAQGELDKYNSVTLSEKFASIMIDDSKLVDTQGNLYTWNGTNLVDQNGNVRVDEVQLVDAQGHVHEWNGTDLDDRDAYVSVDTGEMGLAEEEWANTSFPTKTTYVDVVRRGDTGDAAGGFYSLHASGGFITNGPTLLGRDRFGINHIAGEAGREWVMNHADGTTSIVPIENKKYLAPYADIISSMVKPNGKSVNVSVNLNYQAGDDAAKLARDVSNRIEAYLNMGA